MWLLPVMMRCWVLGAGCWVGSVAGFAHPVAALANNSDQKLGRLSLGQSCVGQKVGGPEPCQEQKRPDARVMMSIALFGKMSLSIE